MTCPICDSKTISESYSEEPFGTVDWYCMCTMCDYAAQESYGAHKVSFGNNKWIWGYNTPESEVDRIQEEIDVALLNAKVLDWQVASDSFPLWGKVGMGACPDGGGRSSRTQAAGPHPSPPPEGEGAKPRPAGVRLIGR